MHDVYSKLFRFCKLQSENMRVLAHSSDSFNFRYSAFHTVCRVDLVEFASPTAGIGRGVWLNLTAAEWE